MANQIDTEKIKGVVVTHYGVTTDSKRPRSYVTLEHQGNQFNLYGRENMTRTLAHDEGVSIARFIRDAAKVTNVVITEIELGLIKNILEVRKEYNY